MVPHGLGHSLLELSEAEELFGLFPSALSRKNNHSGESALRY